MNSQDYDPTSRNNELDEFLTPVALIEAIFSKAIVPEILFKVETILDVGANDGRWGKVARTYYPDATLVGIEIMNMPTPEEYDVWIVQDFIEWESPFKFDLIVGNPPFTVREIIPYEGPEIVYKAENFVRKSLSLLSPLHGMLGFLLRSNFRHTQERHANLFKEHYPYHIHELDRRPSFYKEDKRTKYYGKGNTNAHDYSFFMWDIWQHKFALSIPLVWNY